MKKLFIFLISAVTVIFNACTPAPPSQPVLDFEAKITVDGEKAFDGLFSPEAEITSTMQGAVTIKTTTPDELWGLTYKWSDGFEIIYDGLHAQTQKGYLPDDAYAQAVYNVLCAMSREQECDSFSEGVAVFTGECPGGSYRAVTDAKGYIQNISIEEINLNVDFIYE